MKKEKEKKVEHREVRNGVDPGRRKAPIKD